MFGENGGPGGRWLGRRLWRLGYQGGEQGWACWWRNQEAVGWGRGRGKLIYNQGFCY